MGQTGFFCRKCLVKTMCNKKCDKIRSVLHIISILQASAIMVLCLSWAMGFGLSFAMPESKKIVSGIFIGVLIISFLTTYLLKRMRNKIDDQFNEPENHISKWI